MNFELDDQHIQLQTAARSALARKLPIEKLRASIDPHDGLRGLVEELWPWVADMGWTGVCIPEEAGGLGLGLTEALLLHEEFGRALLVGPYCDTSVFAARLLQQAAQRMTPLLPGIVDGSVRVVHGRLSTAAATDLLRDHRAQPSPAVEATVVWADAATHILWTGYANDQQAIAACIPCEQHDIYPRRTSDPTQTLASVRWRAEAQERVTVLVLPAKVLARAENASRMVRCGELLGLATRALEETVAYVSQRHQFGKPVGSFQAVKHLLADAFVALENARTALRYAAGVMADDNDAADLALDIAVVACVSMANRLTADCIQAHGGTAFTWESHMHLYFKRAQHLGILIGNTADARRRIASVVLDGSHALLS